MTKRYGTSYRIIMNVVQDSSGNVYPSVEALATALGISRQSTYSALRSGEIPSIRLGKRFILPKAAIQEWLRSAGGTMRPTA